MFSLEQDGSAHIAQIQTFLLDFCTMRESSDGLSVIIYVSVDVNVVEGAKILLKNQMMLHGP